MGTPLTVVKRRVLSVDVCAIAVESSGLLEIGDSVDVFAVPVGFRAMKNSLSKTDLSM
jgi:hypothetical protein